MSLADTLVQIWRQAPEENRAEANFSGCRYPIRRTARNYLLQADFVVDGRELRGLEQNPDTNSRCAKLARGGHKVMQFLSEGRYIANVVDGTVTLYSKAREYHRRKATFRRSIFLPRDFVTFVTQRCGIRHCRAP